MNISAEVKMPYKNKEDRDAYQKWYKKKFPEKVRRLNRNWVNKNREKVNNYSKIYYKRYFKTKKGKEIQRKIARKQRLVNYEKILARKRLNYSVEYGHIKKEPCKKCGALRVEGHHKDYSKPLDVIWLCNKHHRELHRGLIWK